MIVDDSLRNKVVIVTGGSRDIGGAISLAFGEGGACVVVNYNQSQKEAEGIVNSIKEKGGRAISVRADVSKWDQVQHLIDEARKSFGNAIHVLVNNAGSFVEMRTLQEADESFWDRVMDVNAKSTFLACKAVIPFMPKGSAIVNISSMAARNGGGPGKIIYAASKGAVSTLTRGLAKELGPLGIRVNCIEPGYIDTRFHETTPPDVLKQMVNATLVKRAGRADEVASVTLFLAGDQSSFINGQAIPVNGGAYFV